MSRKPDGLFPKINVSITLDASLYQAAKQYGLNVSKCASDGIRAHIRLKEGDKNVQ